MNFRKLPYPWIRSTTGRLLFSLVPIMVGLIALALSKGMYQTMDEIDMRSLIEGTAGDGSVSGTPFCLYSNVIYGYILRFLYVHAPSVYWYDVFSYLFLTISIFGITFLLETDSVRRNVMSVCVMSGVAAYYFALPQFTLTSGLLAVASALCVVSLARETNAHSSCALCLLALFFGVLSSLIRFNCFLVVGVFAGLLFVFSLKLRWSRFLRVSVTVGCGVLALAFALKFMGRELVQENVVWNELAEFNRARARIVDSAGAWEEGWKPLAPLADKFTAVDGFDSADYRCLLSHCSIGRKESLNAEKLTKVSGILAEKISLNRPLHLHFLMHEVRGHFFPLLLMALFGLAVFNKCLGFKFACILLAFIGMVGAISTFIHYVPIRLWWNFATVCLVAVLLLNPCGFDIARYVRWPFVLKGIPFAVLFVMLLSLQPYIEFQRAKYFAYAKAYEQVALPADYVYLMDFWTTQMLAAAFRPNPNANRSVIVMGELARFPHYDDLLQKANISQCTTWEDVCSLQSRVRFVYFNYFYNCRLDEICRTIAFYIGRKTGERVVAERTDIGHCVSLLRLKRQQSNECGGHLDVIVDEDFTVSQLK